MISGSTSDSTFWAIIVQGLFLSLIFSMTALVAATYDPGARSNQNFFKILKTISMIAVGVTTVFVLAELILAI
jgi:hypothetical protein